jgi:single-strand DNA-binding protein
MFTINRVMLVGRLTKEPELGVLRAGVSVCRMRIACNSDKRVDQGNYQKQAHYFNVNVYGEQAEDAVSYTRKGGRVAIEGRLVWREWEAPEGLPREVVSVAADTVLFLDDPDSTPPGQSPPQS